MGWFGLLHGPGGLLAVSAFCDSQFLAEKRLFEAASRLLPGQKGELAEDESLEEELVKRIRDYLSGKRCDFGDIRIDLGPKTGLSSEVLRELRHVKYGSTISYADLARKCRHAGAARAVGNIMAGNPLPIVVPCHRVVRSDGGAGMYMKGDPKGPEIKKKLLAMESGTGKRIF